MRLLRPPVLKRSISAGWPSSAWTTSRACVSDGSFAVTEHLLFNVPPGRANDVGFGLRTGAAFREQNPLDTVRESGVGEHFFQIVDEMRTAESCDARDFLLSRSFEIDILQRNAVAVVAEKTLRRHPFQSRPAQIHALRIVVAE